MIKLFITIKFKSCFMNKNPYTDIIIQLERHMNKNMAATKQYYFIFYVLQNGYGKKSNENYNFPRSNISAALDLRETISKWLVCSRDPRVTQVSRGSPSLLLV